MNSIITTERIDAYCLSLLADERSAGTISKYRRDLTAFARWLDGRTVTKETAAGWKSHLSHRGYAPRTINSMLASLNSFWMTIIRMHCSAKLQSTPRFVTILRPAISLAQR